ncbi:acyltransferase family protein [Thermovibrio guaymasensis]|nr:acyltransferase [Thermovibrio guaymasensis]
MAVGVKRMTGYLRFFLAYLVLLSHTGFRVHGMNPGVFAVVIFYILAGHVVTHLLLDIFWKRGKSTLLFYLDRILRIYPLYFYVSLITLIFLAVTSFGGPKFSLLNIANNFLVIPLNYYMFIQDNLIILTSTKPPWWLIPPAWSLGAELQVYILLPLLIKIRKLGLFLLFGSFIVYSLANLNVVHSDYYGYRLIVGTLFIFMIGSFLQKIANKKITSLEFFSLFFIYIICVAWFIYFVVVKHTYGAYTRETLLGIILGTPVVYWAIINKKNLPFNRFLGSLSYGVFLSHFLSIWLLEYIGISPNNLYYLLLITIIVILISVIGVFLIEKPIEKIRFNL